MSSLKGVLVTTASHPVVKAARKRADELRFRLWQARLAEEPVLERPIFMIGAPRSGTSVAVSLFAMHPWVANRTEAGLLWDPAHFFDPEADHYWGPDRVTEQDARRLHAWFEFYRQKGRKKRLINKHPRNSVRIEYIRKIFPDAFFIHVIRDGRAVASSIVNRTRKEPYRHSIPFGNFCRPPGWRELLRDDPYEQAALQWREIVRYVLARRHELGDRYHEFKYEEMCARPREILAAAFEFSELPVSEEVLLQLPHSLPNMNHKYEEQLSPDRIRAVTRVQGELLQELGYHV